MSVSTKNPRTWVSFLAALGLIYQLQGCSQRPEAPKLEGKTLVAATVLAAVEVRDSQESSSQAADSFDNLVQLRSSALGANETGHPKAYSPAELLEAFLWIAGSGDPYDVGIRDAIAQALAEQGLGALWEIRRYLLSDDASQTSHSTDEAQQQAYLAVLDVLLSLDLPEVEDLAVELIAGDPSPEATWRLARYLEDKRPGIYTAQIRNAAENALTDAFAAENIPGELFQVLAKTGDVTTVSLLADLPVHWDAYVSVAFALLPDGSGLPLLEQDARLFERGQQTLHGRLAIDLLAQQAHRFPDAAEVIVDLAERNLIPSDMWPELLAIVSGQWELSLQRPRTGVVSTHTIYRPEGHQVLYIIARSGADESPEIADRRLALSSRLRALAPVSSISG